MEQRTFNLRRLHVVHAVRTFFRLEFDSSGEILEDEEESSLEGLSGLNDSWPIMKHAWHTGAAMSSKMVTMGAELIWSTDVWTGRSLESRESKIHSLDLWETLHRLYWKR